MAWESGLVERLRRGETVTFRPHGNSMAPRIKSGQLVTVAPAIHHEDVAVYQFGDMCASVTRNDVVFCKVGGRLMLHLVTAYRAGQYQISNSSNHVNGWTPAKNIYGVLIGVES